MGQKNKTAFTGYCQNPKCPAALLSSRTHYIFFFRVFSTDSQASVPPAEASLLLNLTDLRLAFTADLGDMSFTL